MIQLKLLCLFCATSLSLCQNINDNGWKNAKFIPRYSNDGWLRNDAAPVGAFHSPSVLIPTNMTLNELAKFNKAFGNEIREQKPQEEATKPIKLTNEHWVLQERQNKEKLDKTQKIQDEEIIGPLDIVGEVAKHQVIHSAIEHPGEIFTVLEGLFAGVAFIVSNVCFCAWYRKRKAARASALPTNIEAGEIENPLESSGSQEQLQENIGNSTTHDGPVLIRPLPPYAGQDAANSTTYDGPVLISPLPTYTEIMEKRQKATTS